ncbi:MAG: MaoC/PaaZ C-terminal domain-containing protein [Acidimicrobiia bacterium]|nr:MaoC/PaaZ C-terminal domain-containing protein [Acidimicrobiia bacterium]
MPLDSLTGRAYGPHPFRVCADKVTEYLLATGDDPARWNHFAPPTYASLALFNVAPAFLEDPQVAPFTRVLVHADQTFRWYLPWALEEVLSVRGMVERIRARGSSYFVTFTMTVDNAAGERALDSSSTFVMSSESPETEPEEESEPPVTVRARNEVPAPAPLPAVQEALPELAKSASRADLVRYAGATRDWNPIHFDHDAAVAAGLPGVVVHGLLMTAWAAQAATRLVSRPLPLTEARFRFRAPLRPGQPAVVTGVVEADDGKEASIKAKVVAGDLERVTATMIVRRT